MADESITVNPDSEKVMGVIAYILFFVPLLAAKDSGFAMYHANQGLTLFLLAVAVNVVGAFVPVLGWFIVLPLGNILVLVLGIIGIVNALNGKKQPLPLIGQYTFLK